MHVCTECGGVLSGETGSLRSPRHPDVYPHGVNCTWFIRVPQGLIIQLSFDSFLLERNYACRGDYVEIFDSYTLDHSLGRYVNINKILMLSIGSVELYDFRQKMLIDWRRYTVGYL